MRESWVLRSLCFQSWPQSDLPWAGTANPVGLGSVVGLVQSKEFPGDWIGRLRVAEEMGEDGTTRGSLSKHESAGFGSKVDIGNGGGGGGQSFQVKLSCAPSLSQVLWVSGSQCGVLGLAAPRNLLETQIFKPMSDLLDQKLG